MDIMIAARPDNICELNKEMIPPNIITQPIIIWTTNNMNKNLRELGYSVSVLIFLK